MTVAEVHIQFNVSYTSILQRTVHMNAFLHPEECKINVCSSKKSWTSLALLVHGMWVVCSLQFYNSFIHDGRFASTGILHKESRA